MLALLRPYQDFGQEKLGVEVGSVDSRLEGDRTVVRAKPASLAVLIGQANMEKTKADFAIVNGGGVRDSIAAGKITYKDLLKVQPFGNTLSTVDLSADEVMSYLNAAAKMSVGSGAFAQFTGISLDIAGGQALNVRINNAALAAGKTYRMVINNFQATGGDGYPKVSEHKSYVNTGFVDADVLKSYVSARSPLKAADYDPGSAVTRR